MNQLLCKSNSFHFFNETQSEFIGFCLTFSFSVNANNRFSIRFSQVYPALRKINL